MTLPKFLLGSAFVAGTLVNGLALPASARHSLSVRRRVDLAPLQVPSLPVAKRQDQDEGPEPTITAPSTPIDEEPEPVPTAPSSPIEGQFETTITAPSTPIEEEFEPVPTAPPTPIVEEFEPVPTAPSSPIEGQFEPTITAPSTPIEEEFEPVPTAPPTPIVEEFEPVPTVPSTPIEEEFEPTITAPSSPIQEEPVPTPNQPSSPNLPQEGLTCVGKNPGSTFTYTTSAGKYDVLCGLDYLNANLRSLQTKTFADCLETCDKEAACVTVAYANDVCYLKNQVSATVSNANVWAAKKQSAKESLTCVNGKDNSKVHQASKGLYNIVCGKEYAGGDLASTSTASFEACIEACAGTDKCIDVSYVNGACYMKDTKTSLIQAGHVWTAELIGAGPISAEPKPKVEELSCINSKDNGKIYTAPSGKKYTVECGIDHAGGDFLTVPHETTFQSCMDVCDSTTGCVDVSWVWGTCYLKNKLTKGVALSHVWTGRPIEEEKAKEAGATKL